MAVLCALLVPLPVQAQADKLEWVKIDKPGLRGNIVVSPSEVSEIAVGGRGTIYALDSSGNPSAVYQSLNAGATWEDITSRLKEAGADLPASKIAIALDKPGTVAVVTNSGTEVYLSTDGGVTWLGTNVPSLAGTTIQAITISKQYTEAEESLREIAIGTAAWGDSTTTGQVWTLKLGKSVSSWQNQRLTVEPGYVGGEVSAISYSPNYQRDNTIIVVASTGTTNVTEDYQNQTWVCIGKRDTAAGTTLWNEKAFSGYPVEIATASSPSAGDAPGVSISSSLALPSNYSSSLESTRRLFVSYDRHPADANDDVYRLDDTNPNRLNANRGANINISSIAYYGTTSSGKLLAGDASPAAASKTVQVRRASNPFASPPAWQSASAPPSGPGNAKVSWSQNGDQAYCGTGQSPGAARDESAFSMSSDDGDNWQQLSLIDTTLTLSDIAPAPDGKTLFVASNSTYGPEGIWRSASTLLGRYWSRQLAMDTTSNRIILRLSPNYASDYTIYAAEAGGELIAVSHNRGNSWKWRRAPEAVGDIVVEDENTVYAALSGGRIRKSTDGAWNWGEPVYTDLPDINMLAIAEKETILAGGRNGEVAYSTDGGASFTRINEVIGSGDIQVVADTNYRENGIIYAATNATDEGIWRWVIRLSTSWEQIDESMTSRDTGQCIGGLAMGPEGTLYALRMENASSVSGGMTRSLNPAARYDTEIEFDFVNYALPADAALDYLKLSGDSGQNELWSIDTAREIIYLFQDALCKAGPTPEKPISGDIIPATTRDGGIYPTFYWEELPWATNYEVAIYLAPDGTQRVWSDTSTTTGLVTTGDNKLPHFSPGTTFYWQVRAIEPTKSPWSETRSFTIEPAAALVPSLLSPADGGTGISQTPAFSWSPVSGTAAYRFVLANNTGLASPIVDTTITTPAYAVTNPLELGKTYFWAVKTVAPVEGNWSTTANFTVKETPAEPLPPVAVSEIPPSVINIPAPSLPPPDIVVPPSPPAPAPTAPAYIWAIIITITGLIVAVIFLIVRTGRPV